MGDKKWGLLFVVFVLLLIADILILDTLPVIDEAILMVGTYLTGKKAYGAK